MPGSSPQPTAQALRRRGSTTLALVGRVIHFEIHCGNLDRAERFYADVFGWRIDHWEGAPVDYRLITTRPARTTNRELTAL